MAGIALFEDLKAAREKGLGIYALPYAFSGRWLEERTQERFKGEAGKKIMTSGIYGGRC